MLKAVIIMSLVAAIPFTMSAQVDKVWSLDECICYAEEHNINIQKQVLLTDKSKLSLQEGKWAFVPSLAATTNYTASTGRVLDPTTYQFVETNLTGNNSTSISGDISVFEGGKKIHVLEEAKLSLRAALLKEESVKYNMKINVIAAYMDILCAKEQVCIAEQSASLVESQLNRSKILLEAGKITESDVLQLQSQLFAAQNDISSAKHSEQMAKLSLCDLLEIDDFESFQVCDPSETIVSRTIVDIEDAVEKHPDYQLSLLSEKIALSDYKIARSSMYPRLSLSAGYGSSFSDARKKSIQNPDGTITYKAYPFFQQYADNASAYVSVGLKIPILTGLTSKNGMQRAKIAIKEAEITTIEKRKQMRKEILQAEIDCQTAEEKYIKAVEAEKYAEEAQRQISEKYNLGTTDFLSWNTSIVELAKSRYSLVEAKFSFILKNEILKLYSPSKIE